MARRLTLVEAIQLIILLAFFAVNLAMLLLYDTRAKQRFALMQALAEQATAQRDAALALVGTWRDLAVKAQQRCGNPEQRL